MKICLVAEEYSYLNHGGGVGAYTYHLAFALRNLGHTVHIITRAVQNNQESLFENGIWIHYISDAILLPSFAKKICSLVIANSLHKIERSWSVWNTIRSIKRNEGLDIIEVPLWGGEGFIYALLSTSKDVPFVVRLETPLVRVIEIENLKKTFDLRIASWIEAVAARRANKIIAISNAISHEVSTHYKLDTRTITIVPLGIPITADRNLRQVNPEKFCPKVMYLGRLEKRKGTSIFLAAIPLVLQRFPNVEFVVIGKDSATAPDGMTYQEYARQLLSEETLQHIIFTGPLPRAEVDRHFADSDIFVAPSVYESFGIVYIEAMSWGKPVIGCRVGGVPEVVADGETGLLVPPQDANALADAIVEMLSNTPLRERMSEAARQRVETYFTDIAMAENTLAAYRDALQARHMVSVMAE